MTRFYPAALMVGALLLMPGQAAAQSTDDWDVMVAPYLMGAGLTGNATLLGRPVEIDLSTSEILDNLEFGFMGLLAAKKGNWGFGADALWMALGVNVHDTEVDFNQGAFAFYGIRELSPAADLTFGMRVNTLQGEFTFNNLGGARVADDKTWVDPIAGLTLRTPAGRRMQLRLYSEIGGFGAGSDLTWQLFPSFGINFGRTFSTEFGYRWLAIDYKTGDGNREFVYDVLTQGPFLGFGFRF